MSILICGSMAFDNIMVFPDRFKNHILPDKVHILNVAFLVPEMRREFGGCAGNIAYNLKLLGGDPLVMATVGDDFGPYAERMDRQGISRQHVRHVAGTYTAQAFITTDLDDNQITAFHPGAMQYAHQNDVAAAQGVELAIVAPDGRDGMITHCKQLARLGIPFVFDPGQGLPMFDGVELLELIDLASYVTLNDYEAQLMQDRTGQTLEQLATRVKALIVTLGGQGSRVYVDGKVHEIACARVDGINDPTGCGDAYRAGLLFGITRGYDWIKTARLAAVLGAQKIESHGPQNHRFTPEAVAQRYLASFGEALW